jgi:hypothetical protein
VKRAGTLISAIAAAGEDMSVDSALGWQAAKAIVAVPRSKKRAKGIFITYPAVFLDFID